MPDELDRQLREGAERIRDTAAQRAPEITGTLAGGYEVRGTAGRYWVTNEVPYAAGAEFGVHGKWRGFASAGPRAERFLFAAKRMLEEEMGADIRREIDRIMEANGWLS